MLININDQSTNVPSQLGDTKAPGFDILKNYGWRIADETIPLEEGYERIWLQDWNDMDRALPLDTLISDRLERERLANLEANRDRWLLENNFLLLCDSLTNTTEHAKLGFPEIEVIITGLMETNQTVAVQLSLKLLMLDSALKRYDLLWWDSCEWHNFE
jgi:hypothetical protein